MEDASFAPRVCKVLGVETIILTNAAGGLNPEYNVGDLVCLNDHLNLAGLVGFHPLRGPNLEEFGTRFPPLSDAYDIHLRQLAHRSWKELRQQKPSDRRLHEGVYAFVAGPTYETRAECRMLRNLGADLVGMSTVPEIVTARHSGMRVLAFSLVTNKSVLEPTVRADDPELQGLTDEDLDRHLPNGMANHAEVRESVLLTCTTNYSKYIFFIRRAEARTSSQTVCRAAAAMTNNLWIVVPDNEEAMIGKSALQPFCNFVCFGK